MVGDTKFYGFLRSPANLYLQSRTVLCGHRAESVLCLRTDELRLKTPQGEADGQLGWQDISSSDRCDHGNQEKEEGRPFEITVA